MPAAPSTSLIPSPCISVCRMNPRTGWCEGCFRTLDEIAAWGSMSDRDKRVVWKLLPARKVQAATESKT
jgi:predicted Fe-S protein YdhL (DUF1289 family)